MQKNVVCAVLGLLLMSGMALAQSPSGQPAYPNPSASAANQLTPQMLGEMLRSATTFHDLVQNMNLNKSLGPDQHIEGRDGRLHHPLERTVQTIGAGVGAGAAIGAMSRSQNGVLIGALVGAAGGLIIDQVLKHREDVREREYYGSSDDGYAPYDHPRELQRRDQDQDH